MSRFAHRSWLFHQQNGLCALCDEPMVLTRSNGFPNSATVDHIIPKSLGGVRTRDNMRLACRDCNTRRGAPGHVPVTESSSGKYLPFSSGWLRARGYL